MKKKPIEPEMQDAVIYTRYSSHNQRDCSIEQQVADCEIFARQNNLRVVKVYADRHLSGTTDNRPQFQQMLKDASHGHWAYVICWKIDRFARNRYDSATYKFRLKKAGVRVLYAKESIPDGPEGILLESVLEGSAEYYSAALAQNIRRGMKFNAEQCKVNSGSIPFGYCKGPDGRFAVHEANAEVVREIFRKAAAGMPFVDIANDLNSRGLKTSRGGRWNKGSFRLLMNEAYIGVYHFSDTRIEGGMPALIDQGTFWAANERLKANSSVRGRHQDGGDYLLTGKLKCAHCGSYMIGFSGTGKSGELHYYYGCQKRRRERACKKANVPREWIERVVVKAALDYVLRPEVMEWIADAVMEYQEREAASAQLAALTAELEENRKATDNVMKAIEAGIITSTTKQRLLDLEAKAQDLKRAIELEKLSHVRLERDQILFWLDRFRGGSLQSQEFRRKVIDAFVSVVYLFDDHLRIAFNYSGGSNAEADFDLVMDAEAAAGELSKKFAQGHVASTNRNAVEPSEFDVVSSSSGGFLLAEMGKITRSKSPVFWSVILNLTSARSSYSRMDETNVSRMRRRYSSSTSSSSRRNCSNMNVSASRLNWGGAGALLISPRAKVSWASCSSRARRRAARRALPPSSMASRILFCLRRHSASSASRASFSGLPFGSCSLACNSIMQCRSSGPGRAVLEVCKGGAQDQL